MDEKETKEETLKKLLDNLPLNCNHIDIYEAYRLARNKVEALTDTEIIAKYDKGDMYDFYENGWANGYIEGIIEGRDLFINPGE